MGNLLPATASALVQAKTVTVHEQIRTFDYDTGKSSPLFSSVVLISRPGKVKVVALLANRPGIKPYLYVADGKAEHEYSGRKNQYSTIAPQPDGTSESQFRALFKVNLILNGGPEAADREGKRGITSETLDGRRMVVTTDTQPAFEGSDGITYVSSSKIWVDSKTRLPYRCEEFITSQGKTTPQEVVDFSDWALNKPIPVAQLAWHTPTGAKLSSEPKLLADGTPAPDFAALTPDGKTVHLSDFKGKIVVLDFWATWCGPCQQSMPHLEQVYQQVKDKNVAVLGLCVWDQKDAYNEWVAKNIGTKYNFPVAFDPAGRGKGNIAESLYAVTGIPTQYVIDKDGNVTASTIGYDKGNSRLEISLNKLGVNIPVPSSTASAR